MSERAPTPDFISTRPLNFSEDSERYLGLLAQLSTFEPDRPYLAEAREITGANRIAPRDRRPHHILVADAIYGDSLEDNSRRESCIGTVTADGQILSHLVVDESRRGNGIGPHMLDSMVRRLRLERQDRFPGPVELFVEIPSTPAGQLDSRLVELYQRHNFVPTFQSQWMSFTDPLHRDNDRPILGAIPFTNPGGTLDMQAQAGFTHLWNLLTDKNKWPYYDSTPRHMDQLSAALRRDGHPRLQRLGLSDEPQTPMHLYGHNHINSDQGYMTAMVLEDGVPYEGLKHWAAITPDWEIPARNIGGRLLRQLIIDRPKQWNGHGGYYIAQTKGGELIPFHVNHDDRKQYEVDTKMTFKDRTLLLGELVVGAEMAGLQPTPNPYVAEEWVKSLSEIKRRQAKSLAV